MVQKIFAINKCNRNCEIWNLKKEYDNEHYSKCISKKFFINKNEIRGICANKFPKGTSGETFL